MLYATRQNKTYLRNNAQIGGVIACTMNRGRSHTKLKKNHQKLFLADHPHGVNHHISRFSR